MSGFLIGAPSLAALLAMADALRPVAHLIDAGQPAAPALNPNGTPANAAAMTAHVAAAAGSGMLAPPPGQEDEEAGPVNENAPHVDSSGLPWDARIHSDTKGTNQDGTWRKRRKVDQALVQSVEAELRSRANPTPQMPAPMFTEGSTPAAPQMPSAPVVPSMPQMPAPPAPPVMPAAPQMPSAPAVPSMPQMPAPPAPPVMPQAPAGITQNEFLTKLAGAMQATNPATGQAYLDQEYLQHQQARYQIEDFNKPMSVEVMEHFLNTLRTDGKLLPGT